MIRIAALVLSLCAASGCAGHALAKDLPVDDHSAGHKVYVTKCAKCHRFYDPAKYSEADWEMWMAKMSKKAKLKPDQEAELLRYVSENLRPPNGTNAANVKTLIR